MKVVRYCVLAIGLMLVSIYVTVCICFFFFPDKIDENVYVFVL
ncbi:MAG: hypothetical protein V1742_02885 [Pseudomonadota bacterium]